MIFAAITQMARLISFFFIIYDKKNISRLYCLFVIAIVHKLFHVCNTKELTSKEFWLVELLVQMIGPLIDSHPFFPLI